MCTGPRVESAGAPEVLLAKAFKDDLNVDINPQALRMFIRSRWGRVSTLAHSIHGAGEPEGLYLSPERAKEFMQGFGGAESVSFLGA